MKSNPLSFVGAILLTLLTGLLNAQTIGIKASAVYISDCTQSDFQNTSGNIVDLIGPSGNTFTNTNFGAHTQNSGSLILRGAQVKTFKAPLISNVCTARMYYRVYLQSGAPGAFSSMDLPYQEDCNTGTGQFSTGSACVAGDQIWNRVVPDGVTSPYAPVDLTARPPGDYVVEVYYDISGSSTSTTACDETVVLNNGGANYKAFFSIQAPVLQMSTNPTTCNGSEGSITISGLVAGVTYSVTYSDDGANVGPVNLTASGSGQLVISGLNAGVYANFSLTANGCTSNLFTGVILSNPVFVPTFSPIAPFCAGTTAPVLPTTSNNGIPGTWSPATVNNMASGSYTFTPTAGYCGLPVIINITVIPRTTPTFSFGTSLTICAGGTVPTLPTTSMNGYTGTWSPATVDNMNSGTYTFTPNANQCANPATFTVTVTPNVTPTFAFGTDQTYCAGASVPTLPTTSDNGITGTWSPSAIDNMNSGAYTFTPTAGQCATTASLNVTINPVITPTFSFGNNVNLCQGGTAPTLPGTSDNGVAGTWSPATVNNNANGTYTFTPSGGQCANPFVLNVSVLPNVTPTFAFGTSQTICAGAAVPALPGTSDNGITGTWSPATVDNNASGTYTFTPDAGQCAVNATFAVTVNPNVMPTFAFGNSQSYCAGAAVPTLPATSDNGITGTWSPATIDNNASATYTFTPTAGQCAVPTTFDVTINPNTTPTFAFGTTLTICAGGTVPSLPGTSDNGVAGTWSPATVDNMNSGTYTFTPSAGLCAPPVTFTVTVNSNVTPTFAFGTALSVCDGGTVPALPATANNGITGTWSPSAIDNTTNGSYTFTPDAGQCATTATLNVTVNPVLTPAFSFGTSMSICAGATVPALPATSDNGITGTWSPSVIDNQNTGTYTFTPDAGQCANPATLDVSVTPNMVPTFSFGNSLTICPGEPVPALPNTSDNGMAGTWSPATVSNQASGTYTFTPSGGGCVLPFVYTVTVNPNVTATFNFGTFQSICIGATVPTLPTTSQNGITGTWNPAVVDNMVNGTYTFTPDPGQCAAGTGFTLEVNSIPVVGTRADTTVYDGDYIPRFDINGTGASVNWTNSNTEIGLGASGAGYVPGFTGVNRTNDPITGIVLITSANNGCVGPTTQYKITVRPIDKDVFVPNVFSPNGDGKNDILYVYGNYIDNIEMRIYNQWGEQIAQINDKSQGWDGKHKGTPQPVGVYVYVLKALVSDGRIQKTVTKKGSITLIR